MSHHKHHIDFATFDQLLAAMACYIKECMCHIKRPLNVYPVPRGGVPVALGLSKYVPCVLVASHEMADIIVDDIIDSGSTRNRFPIAIPFFALVDKVGKHKGQYPGWVVFPWESSQDTGVEDNVRRLLQAIGEKPEREGLKDTPERVAKAWVNCWASGYGKDPGKILKVFADGGEKYDQMVTVADIPIYSHCEHHLAPIFGKATISYIPNGKIVGLSKLSRLADIFARRLQVQERLTDQIADALVEHLQPKGVGVVIKARHMCMESRGVNQQGHHTVTTALRGVILSDSMARAEFLQVANK